jgi:hypothetical protein
VWTIWLQSGYNVANNPTYIRNQARPNISAGVGRNFGIYGPLVDSFKCCYHFYHLLWWKFHSAISRWWIICNKLHSQHLSNVSDASWSIWDSCMWYRATEVNRSYSASWNPCRVWKKKVKKESASDPAIAEPYLLMDTDTPPQFNDPSNTIRISPTSQWGAQVTQPFSWAWTCPDHPACPAIALVLSTDSWVNQVIQRKCTILHRLSITVQTPFSPWNFLHSKSTLSMLLWPRLTLIYITPSPSIHTITSFLCGHYLFTGSETVMCSGMGWMEEWRMFAHPAHQKTIYPSLPFIFLPQPPPSLTPSHPYDSCLDVLMCVLVLASGCELGQARPKSWLGIAFGLV